MNTRKPASLYSFKYQPLDELRNEIRLLTVRNVDRNSNPEHCHLNHTSSDESSVVCCTLEHAPLSQPPSYKGLSYCWGDLDDPSTIHLNGAEVQVTQNLEAALRELARQRTERLWVDALCINQSDIVERGRQVLRMNDIYKTASETICWLGVENEDCPLAFDLINILAQPDDDPAQYEDALTPLYRPSKNHEYEAHWKAFLRLFSRPYWRRVWIIQEIVASRKVRVQCGSYSVIWENLIAAANSVPTASKRSRITTVTRVFTPNIEHMMGIVSMNALRGIVQESKSKSEYVSLLNAMTRSNTALATILIDKVYALLAITKDGQDLIPHPDYTLSPEEICTTTTAAIITASADLDIICYAAPSHSMILPSWVPNWTERIFPIAMATQTAGCLDLYNATGRSKGDEYLRMPHTGKFLNECLILKARGFIVDVVNGLGPVDLDNGRPFEVDEETNYGLIQPESDRNSSPYGSEGELFTALWMSLVLGESVRDGDGDSEVTGSKLLNSLYVLQASHDSAIDDVMNESFRVWYSMNKKFEIYGRTLSQWLRVSTADPTKPERAMNDLTDEEVRFLEVIMLTSFHKRLMFTHEGYIGMAPHHARKGDIVCLLLGCRIPVVLRERKEGGFRLVGEAYVHGIMKGEAMTKDNEERSQDFCIH